MTEPSVGELSMIDEFNRNKAEQQRESAVKSAPWTRHANGKIDTRLIGHWSVPSYLGPFYEGDEVIVNGTLTGVIELATANGMLVVPKPPENRDEQDPGAWFPAGGIASIAPVKRMLVVRAPLALPDEPTGEPDESLPMNPPPALPPEPGIF